MISNLSCCVQCAPSLAMILDLLHPLGIMGGKRKPRAVEWIRCEPCRKDVRNCQENLQIHRSSPSHMRYAELSSKKELLEQWNVGWAPDGRPFFCYACNVPLSCSFEKIEKDHADRHLGSAVEEGVREAPLIRSKWKPDVASGNVLDGRSGSMGGVGVPSRGNKVRCVPCRKDVPNCLYNIQRQNSSCGHKRFVELLSKMETLDRWNIGWAPVGRAFACRHCDVLLGCSFAKLGRHFVDHHTLPTEGEPQLNVFEAFRRKKFYESDAYDFDADKGSFRIVEGPLQLNESAGSCVGLMRHRVVPDVFASRLYDVASDLESGGHEIQRATKKQGTRMVMYGMYNRGYSEWFKHGKKSLYAKSERFVGDVAHFLSVAFPSQMARLWKNLEVEGLPKGEGGFAGTPFTAFAITRDYKCAPHDDPTDYGFGFLLWLHPEHIETDELSSFWLNEYKVRFRPSHASTFFFNGAATVHSTTSHGKAGVLGLAFVQKRNFMTGLAQIIADPDSTVAGGFRKAKVAYERNRDSAKPEGVYRRAVRGIADDID